MQRTIRQVLVIYGSALLQGMGSVSFAASSAILKGMKGLTDAQYGTIFLPLVVTTILGSVLGGILSRKMRLKWLLLAGLCFTIASQVALASIVWLTGAAVLRALLAATAFFGLGFGLSAGPLNAYPGLLFPARKDAALLAMHTVIGAGLSLGPLVAGWFIGRAAWANFPWTLVALGCVLLVSAACMSLIFSWPLQRGESAGTEENPLKTGVLWTCVLLAILYAFAEATYSNWSVIYLSHDRGVAPATAALALSVFWAMFAFGRLLISVILLRVPAVRVWLALPVLMACAFLLLPGVRSAASGIAAFGFAGLACSAFFPLTVGMVSRRFARSTALVSSLMTAGLMVGVGGGSFIVGPLRSIVSMERLYQMSVLYPVLALIIGVTLVRSGKLSAADGDRA